MQAVAFVKSGKSGQNQSGVPPLDSLSLAGQVMSLPADYEVPDDIFPVYQAMEMKYQLVLTGMVQNYWDQLNG